MSKLEHEEPINFQVKSGETAIIRKQPSHMARILADKQILRGNIFDWGCGYGKDLEFYLSLGFNAAGWDPVHLPEIPPQSYEQGSFDWVCCAYVLNTVPTEVERLKILSEIHQFLPDGGHLAVAVRTNRQLADRIKPYWKTFNDGWLTSQGTFQKGFEAKEIVSLVAQVFKEAKVLSANPLIVVAQK